MAFFDARHAFSPGVHDIGDLLFADPADARTLLRLSDDRLLSRLELLRNWSSGAHDACLRECARRGGQRVIAHLEQMNVHNESSTDITLLTARNRAARLADPLVVELVDGSDDAISCTIDQLPDVRLALVNRDPLGRTLRLHCTEPECHDTSLAVDCRSSGPVNEGFRLLRPSHGGVWPTGEGYELGPGEEVVVQVRLSHYLEITVPGRYSLRFAYRMDGSWDLDEQAKELPRGVLFLYSGAFDVEVGAPAVGNTDLDNRGVAPALHFGVRGR